MNSDPQPNLLPPSHHQSTGSGTAVTDPYDFGINHKLGKLCDGAENLLLLTVCAIKWDQVLLQLQFLTCSKGDSVSVLVAFTHSLRMSRPNLALSGEHRYRIQENCKEEE